MAPFLQVFPNTAQFKNDLYNETRAFTADATPTYTSIFLIRFTDQWNHSDRMVLA